MRSTDTRDANAIRMDRLYQAALLVAGTHDVDSALQAIVDASRELVDAEYAALGVPGQPGQPMAHFYYAGVSDEVVRRLGPPPTGHGVLGLLLSGGKIIRVDNVLEHPSAMGYPGAHPLIGGFLGMPIRAGGQVIGDLYLGNKIGGEHFTPEDERLVEMLATHAAVVIQSLRYQEQARAVAAMSEHAQLARQLEDEVLQALYGTGLLLTNIDLTNPERSRQQFAEAQAHLNAAIEHLRAHLLGLTHGRAVDGGTSDRPA